MSRKVLGFDRVVAFLLGLSLVIIGALAISWRTGWLAQILPGTGNRIVAGIDDTFTAGWFAPTMAGTAVVLALLAVWWLLAHVPHHSTSNLTLQGSNSTGRLSLDADSPAQVAADLLQGEPGVRTAKGHTITDRDEIVLELHATCEPTANLQEVAAAANRISSQTRHV